MPARLPQTGVLVGPHDARTVDQITSEEVHRALACGRELVARLTGGTSDARIAPLVGELHEALDTLAENVAVVAPDSTATERDASISRARALLLLSEVRSLIDAITRYVGG
jgi:hypothetical protein